MGEVIRTAQQPRDSPGSYSNETRGHDWELARLRALLAQLISRAWRWRARRERQAL